MQESVPQPVRKNIWRNILFFGGMTVVGFIGAPMYILKCGISLSEVLLFAFFIIATSLSITIGYHRLFTHKTFKTNSFIRFLLLFFGAAAFEETALIWSAQHIDHHKYVDTDLDPYSIKKGFFYAHIGWIFFWEHKINFDNVKALLKDRLVMHQHDHYVLWAVTSGILLPLFLGALTGHFLGAAILVICLRIAFVSHATFFINSICHMFGKATYDSKSSAKDNWLVAVLTFGEGYHNYHHCFPGDYRNGVAWYAWDPTKWIIFLLSKVGLTSNLKRVSKPVQYRTEIKAQYQHMQERLKEAGQTCSIRYSGLVTQFHDQYENMRHQLEAWELQLKQQGIRVSQGIGQYSRDSHKELLVKTQEARERFRMLYADWKRLAQMLQTAAASV